MQAAAVLLLAAALALALGASQASAARAGGFAYSSGAVELAEGTALPVLAAGSGGGARRSLLALPDPARTLGSPSVCSGWPEPRVYLEGQAWFTRPGEDIVDQSSHLHVGACMPHRQRVKGAVTFHVLVQKHLLPGGTTPTAPVNLELRFTTKLPNGKESKYTLRSNALRPSKRSASRAVAPVWTCNAEANGMAANTLCKAVVPMTVKTANARVFVPDGFTRMTAIATLPGLNDGKAVRSLQARIDTFFLVDNRGVASTVFPSNRALGVEQLANTKFPWGYTHAHFTSELWTQPISGRVRFNVAAFTAGAAAKSSNVTGVLITLDPNFHNKLAPNQEGTPLRRIADVATARSECPLVKGHTDCKVSGTEIDTTGLADGYHKLFIRTDSFVAPDSPTIAAAKTNGGTFSAITLISFRVCNALDPATCPGNEVTAPDENPTPPPALPPFDPPPYAAVYRESESLSAVLPPQTQAALAPYDCSGWRGSRYYLESQTWHTPPGGDVLTNSAQVLVGACLPHKQTVAGRFPLDVLLQKAYLRSDANAAIKVKLAFIWKDGNVTFEFAQTGTQQAWVCSNNAPACKAVFRTFIDLRPASGAWLVPDGLNKIELSATLSINDGSPVPRSLMTRLESYVVVANTQLYPAPDLAGKPLGPNTFLRTHIPWATAATGLASELPLGPKAGPLTFKMAFNNGAQTGANVTAVFAAIDAAPLLRPTPYLGSATLISANNGGLAPGSNEFRPISPRPINCTKNNNFGAMTCTRTFDPASVARDCALNPCDGGLCDGTHRLFVRTDSTVAADHPLITGLPADGKTGAGTLSTVLVMPIVTQNGAVRATACGPAPAQAPAELRVAIAAATVGQEGEQQQQQQLAPATVELAPAVASALSRSLSNPDQASGGGIDAASALSAAEAAATGSQTATVGTVVPVQVSGDFDAEDAAANALVFS